MERRQFARFSPDEIPEILRKPILLNDFEEVNSQIVDLSPLGISLSINKEINIDEGSIFHIKYYAIDSYIKCLCVFSDISDDNRIVHAYFTDAEDTKAIMKYLN